MVRVSSLLHATRLSLGWPCAVISLLDPTVRQSDILRAAQFGVDESNHLTRFFEDSENPQRGPSFEVIVEILTWCSTRRDNILVHCHAGMSRSPAIAIGILIARGTNPRVAVQTILGQTPSAQNPFEADGSIMEPNELILQHIDSILGLDGSLIPIVREEMLR